jgi:ABC-type polysaccharide/polyol phosphate transport system ATPase subunit
MKSQNDIAIELKNITKEYIIHHEKPTLVEKFYKGRDEKFIALNNISLTIKKGERVGIIGPNGSGKTTLLKIIVGITTSTQGAVHTYGKVVSLIDLEAGFHPDLTGYQNIFLNGMLLGMKKREIEKKLHTIIEFADIRQFIDAPMFTYSSGMALRLGFAVAVHADPDILILDENLTVGDRFFQQKAKKKLDELFSRQKTFIIVSHIPQLLQQYCKRFVIINNGTILQDGKVAVFNTYFGR